MVQDAKRIVLLLIICLMTFIVSGCSDNIKKEVERQALDLAKAQTYSTAQITKKQNILNPRINTLSMYIRREMINIEDFNLRLMKKIVMVTMQLPCIKVNL